MASLSTKGLGAPSCASSRECQRIAHNARSHPGVSFPELHRFRGVLSALAKGCCEIGCPFVLVLEICRYGVPGILYNIIFCYYP
jgi:hypothetical protein